MHRRLLNVLRRYPRLDGSRGALLLLLGTYWVCVLIAIVIAHVLRADDLRRISAVQWFWLAAILVLPSAVATLVQFRRHRIRLAELRREAGLCPDCGYDLRATPDRCPECGTIPTANAR